MLNIILYDVQMAKKSESFQTYRGVKQESVLSLMLFQHGNGQDNKKSNRRMGVDFYVYLRPILTTAGNKILSPMCETLAVIKQSQL
jgi:hypothetical protein